jgi:hypothetical protein
MSMQSFRQQLAAALKEGLHVDFIDGYVEGPVESKSLGCTYPVRIAEVASNVLVEQQFVGVRVLKQLKTKRVYVERPKDPGELEDLAELLQTVIQANQTGLGPWMLRCTQIDFDLPAWGIEALIIATQANLGT